MRQNQRIRIQIALENLNLNKPCISEINEKSVVESENILKFQEQNSDDSNKCSPNIEEDIHQEQKISSVVLDVSDPIQKKKSFLPRGKKKKKEDLSVA